jgi:hypothetical protein
MLFLTLHFRFLIFTSNSDIIQSSKVLSVMDHPDFERQGRLNNFGSLRRNSKIGFFFLKFFFFFLVIRIFFFFGLTPCNELVIFFSIFSSFSNHWYLNIMMN